MIYLNALSPALRRLILNTLRLTLSIIPTRDIYSLRCPLTIVITFISNYHNIINHNRNILILFTMDDKSFEEYLKTYATTQRRIRMEEHKAWMDIDTGKMEFDEEPPAFITPIALGAAGLVAAGVYTAWAFALVPISALWFYKNFTKE